MTGSDMPDEEGDPESTPTPIRPNPLRDFVKQHSEKRAGGDAVDLLLEQLEFLGESIWKEASRKADEKGRKTVKEEDVQEAYDEFTEPHDLLRETSDKLDWMKRDLDRQVEQSPIYAEENSDD